MENKIKELIDKARNKVNELNEIISELSKKGVNTYGKITEFEKDGTLSPINKNGTPRLALFCKKVEFIEEL